MCETKEDIIRVGDYIVIQRQQYFKLHQLSDVTITLGQDKINLKPVIGERFWSVFRMILKEGSKREFFLELCKKSESLSEVMMKNVTSGVDNRNISDDGNSQMLSTHQIIELRESGLSPQNILGKLIENSKTFASKTEYSQEKYLKKKEKKYSEYIIIRKPTIRLLSEIFYNRDQTKILGLRNDTLSQILTGANIQSNGLYLLFESGTQALVGAAVLNYLSQEGVLINISLGNQPQQQAVLAMNYSKQKLENCLSVKATSFLDCLYPKEKEGGSVTAQDTDNSSQPPGDSAALRKRKLCDGEETEEVSNKKPKWAENLDRACTLLKSRKADALIVACREFPLNLILKLIPFIHISRPLIVYSLFREPLVELYVELKKRRGVIGFHLTESWLRPQQVLPDRTHPDVTMTASGGYLLSAMIVNNDN